MFAGLKGLSTAEAFKPFADYMAGGSFSALPDGMPLTPGSPMARRQITIGDLRKLAASIEAAPAGFVSVELLNLERGISDRLRTELAELRRSMAQTP
jgi:hypothetical protein